MTMQMRIRRLLAGLGCALVTTVAACDNPLEVKLPGVVTEGDLTNPLNATSLANGVVLDFECGWSNYVVAANALSDQLINANTVALIQPWYLRQILPESHANGLTGTCDTFQGYFPYVPLQVTRRGAERAAELIGGFTDAAVPNKAALLATVKVYGAYAALALGEGFCEAVITPGSVVPSREMLQRAEQEFTAVITANPAADLRNMALVGRARVRLDLGNFAGAIADATAVPRGYSRVATRGAGERHRWNLVFEFQNNLDNTAFVYGSVAPRFRNLTFNGVPDPRLGVGAQRGTGNDLTTPFFPHNKATSRATPLPIATFVEARLVRAEAAARSGDLSTARLLINEMHTEAGLPPYDPGNTATAAQVLGQVIDERSRELFMQGGHRLNDMLRFRNTEHKIPFRGEPGSDHPTGRDHRQLDYGPTTCIPLPLAERM
jgi:hypothetical protein